MTSDSPSKPDKSPSAATSRAHHLRFHRPNLHLAPVFGSDWFGQKAEAFARYFGTPKFLLIQTAIVALWIAANALGLVGFDLYPFILLNLAFSLQAAYAAPLILLAQTRQADRDKANADADACHREDIAAMNASRQEMIESQSARLLALLEQNTQLTELTNQLSVRIETLTRDVHRQLIRSGDGPA